MHGLLDRYLKFQDETFSNYGNVAVVIFTILVGILLFSVWRFSTGFDSPTKQARTDAAGTVVAAQAIFLCDDEKSIRAQFAQSQAHLSISDGREVTLPQTPVVSKVEPGFGVLQKYSNPDGSFSFWSNGTSAFISENGIATYVNCKVG